MSALDELSRKKSGSLVRREIGKLPHQPHKLCDLLGHFNLIYRLRWSRFKSGEDSSVSVVTNHEVPPPTVQNA